MPKKILVVDDERHIVRLVQVNLQKDGYEVETANNGQEALDQARAAKPDLIVMDVMMPEMDGFEALKNLKADESTADIPVIMLTAKAQDADVFRGWQSGADLYLTKPFNPTELLSFVKRIFDSQASEEAKTGTFSLDESQTMDLGNIDEDMVAGA